MPVGGLHTGFSLPWGEPRAHPCLLPHPPFLGGVLIRYYRCPGVAIFGTGGSGKNSAFLLHQVLSLAMLNSAPFPPLQ